MSLFEGATCGKPPCWGSQRGGERERERERKREERKNAKQIGPPSRGRLVVTPSPQVPKGFPQDPVSPYWAALQPLPGISLPGTMVLTRRGLMAFAEYQGLHNVFKPPDPGNLGQPT